MLSEPSLEEKKVKVTNRKCKCIQVNKTGHCLQRCLCHLKLISFRSRESPLLRFSFEGQLVPCHFYLVVGFISSASQPPLISTAMTNQFCMKYQCMFSLFCSILSFAKPVIPPGSTAKVRFISIKCADTNYFRSAHSKCFHTA